MSNAQVPNTPFCYRPFCDKPTNFNNSPVLKPESCPSGKDGTGSPLGSAEYEALIARQCMAREEPLESRLCPPYPGMVLPACEAPPPAGEKPCVGRGDVSGGQYQYPAQGRPTCLPPEAFDTPPCGEGVCHPPQASLQDPNLAETYMERGGQPLSDVAEDNRPPRITECKEPPSSSVPPMDMPGTCRSAESNDPGEIRCCIKKCEINPEIFENDPRNRAPDGPLTSEYYKTKEIPYRFDNASGFYGYGCQQDPAVHPFYRTTSQDYGWFRPSVHTVPTAFFPKSQQFSRLQSVGGRYRNTALDTAMAEKLEDD